MVDIVIDTMAAFPGMVGACPALTVCAGLLIIAGCLHVIFDFFSDRL